ncbi:MAG: AraC family transcriptional regulator [Vicinamibacterales bacterium]
MDALSDVLRAVRLTGAVFFDVRAADPWVAETPPGSAVVSSMFPGAEHMMAFHVITRGTAWASCDVESPVRLGTGDVVLFPHGDQHSLASAPAVRDQPALEFYRRPADGQLPFSLAIGHSSIESAHIVCGFLGCDASPFNPLLEALPRVIRVSGAVGGAIGAFAAFASAETRDARVGSDAVLGRLSELLFVDVVRRYLERLGPDQTGWLAGLREPFVGRALGALHREPARDWTIEQLAREVGLSRSALAERFSHLVGQPPMQYLANWRMQLAASALMSGSDNVAEVAERVGYESEAAFSRAFKKATGVPPGEWRRRRQRR